MSCKDCLQNCPEIVSDQCVQYTGPALGDPFDVCTGDQLSVYEANIVAVIQSILDGTVPIPGSVNTAVCQWFQQQFGVSSSTIANLLQALINGECNLNTQIAALAAQVSSYQSGAVLDTSCLTGLSATPSLPEIVQAVILLLCAVNTTVNTFPATYVKLSDLTSLVTTIVNNINGAGSTPTYSSRMVPYVASPYFGPLSNFDSTGAGISSLGFSRIFLCNGLNGTPDSRGRVLVGAIRNVPGGSLDPAVDPSVSANNPNWALLDRLGETFHTLVTSELPAHNHSITDPGHVHSAAPFLDSKGGSSGTPVFSSGDNGRGQGYLSTNASSTGITVQQTGGGQAHNNIQPSIACYHIMYIP